MIATTRIATLEGNYFVAVPVSYNEPVFFFIKEDMITIIREADASEWLWATTEWNSPIERGSWDIENEDWFKIQSKLRQERREKAFELLATFSSEKLENGNVEYKASKPLTPEEQKTLSAAADGVDGWTRLHSIGGSCGKNYTNECELPEGNFSFIDVVVSSGNFTRGFTAYFMQ